jgi:uncharacterized protein YecE (DUF72 family)
MYASSYDEASLASLAQAINQSTAREAWCIFDNTAAGAAAENALRLANMLESRR